MTWHLKIAMTKRIVVSKELGYQNVLIRKNKNKGGGQEPKPPWKLTKPIER